jgi:hypothetical protein
MERAELQRQSLSGVPLPLALAVASFAAPLGVLCWLWISLGSERAPLSLGDAIGMLQIGYLIGMPFALAVSLLIAWPAMAWMRRRHTVAWTSTLGLSVSIGVAVYVAPTMLYVGGAISLSALVPIATMGAMPGLFAGTLLCALLRPPLTVRPVRRPHKVERS